MAAPPPGAAAAGIPADPRPPTSADATPAGVVASNPASTSPLAQVNQTLTGDASSTAASANGAAPALPATLGVLRRVTPMIILGVRSVAPSEIPAEFGEDGQQAAAPASPPSAPPPASTRGGEGLTGRVRRALDGLRGRAGADDAPAAADDADQQAAAGGDAPARPSSEQVDPAEARRLLAALEARRRNTASFVLWVVGGQYPDGHPILTAPGLLTGQMTYNELLALAEVMGNVKPPTASAADIERSTLDVIRGAAVGEWVDQGRIIASSADRCAICLEDYEADEDCRVMGCSACPVSVPRARLCPLLTRSPTLVRPPQNTFTCVALPPS